MSTKTIRCIICDTPLNSDDMLKHGIQVHNNTMAKHIQKKLDELNKQAAELGLAHMEIHDILSEEEVQTHLRLYQNIKEKWR